MNLFFVSPLLEMHLSVWQNNLKKNLRAQKETSEFFFYRFEKNFFSSKRNWGKKTVEGLKKQNFLAWKETLKKKTVIGSKKTSEFFFFLRHFLAQKETSEGKKLL